MPEVQIKPLTMNFGPDLGAMLSRVQIEGAEPRQGGVIVRGDERHEVRLDSRILRDELRRLREEMRVVQEEAMREVRQNVDEARIEIERIPRPANTVLWIGGFPVVLSWQN